MSHSRRVMTSSVRMDYETPPSLVGLVREVLGEVELDPCSSSRNPVQAKRFFTPKDDAFSQAWVARTIYMNPPYGRQIGRWTRRFATAADLYAERAIALVPARVDTRWWQEFYVESTHVLFLRGRLTFWDPLTGAPVMALDKRTGKTRPSPCAFPLAIHYFDTRNAAADNFRSVFAGRGVFV